MGPWPGIGRQWAYGCLPPREAPGPSPSCRERPRPPNPFSRRWEGIGSGLQDQDSSSPTPGWPGTLPEKHPPPECLSGGQLQWGLPVGLASP